MNRWVIEIDMQVHGGTGFPVHEGSSLVRGLLWHDMLRHSHTQTRLHFPPSAAIYRMTADKNITGPIRQLNRETLQSVLASPFVQRSHYDWTSGTQTTEGVGMEWREKPLQWSQ